MCNNRSYKRLSKFIKMIKFTQHAINSKKKENNLFKENNLVVIELFPFGELYLFYLIVKRFILSHSRNIKAFLVRNTSIDKFLDFLLVEWRPRVRP